MVVVGLVTVASKYAVIFWSSTTVSADTARAVTAENRPPQTQLMRLRIFPGMALILHLVVLSQFFVRS